MALSSSFLFLGLHPQHMEVPRLRVELELRLLAYATFPATGEPSRVCDLHHSFLLLFFLNPLSEARDRIRVLLDTSQIRFRCATTGTPVLFFP